MPGIQETAVAAPAAPAGRDFLVLSQKVELDIDFATRSLKGRTEIQIQPQTKDLKSIRLNCRQCTITRLSVEGRGCSITYDDPYARLKVYPSYTVHQYHLIRQKIEAQLKSSPEPELTIVIPRSVQIQEMDATSPGLQNIPLSKIPGVTKREGGGAAAVLETPAPVESELPKMGFKLIQVNLEFKITDIRDGLHFVGLQDDDTRFPHAYTRSSAFPGTASCLFPCVDDPSSRCEWEIAIRCPRTLGDMLRLPQQSFTNGTNEAVRYSTAQGNAMSNRVNGDATCPDRLQLSEEEKALEISVVCSGDMTDDIVDPNDSTHKTVSFRCSRAVSPQNIGFAIGPFEHVDISEFRESDEDEKLGQYAIRVHGFCLPGRTDEVKNSCMALAKAIDYYSVTYYNFPFTSYKLCFVDDLALDVADTASLSICSNRLLFPEDILDPIESVTRTLAHALAAQWMGIGIIPKEPEDWWVIVGGAYFMTDMFLQNLCGRNEYRFRKKLDADRVVKLDIERPSLRHLGAILQLDKSEMEFMALKAPLVMFILNQRMIKASGRNGLNRVFAKLLLMNTQGQLPDGAITTSTFHRVCEKIGHMKLDSFFAQWVEGAGCPHFMVSQRFNKKKLVVEMTITQKQAQYSEESNSNLPLEAADFMRQAKEDIHEVYADPIQPLFTGPMTIRIHEADGTPYEHIVDIKEVLTKVEIPYNTKYKRLKRSRRQKERAAAAAGLDISGEVQDDVLLYCLGDVLQSEDEVRHWRLADWSKEDEERMNQESYEWIRMDADLEWICTMTLSMAHYMFVSQLQQDKDVVAQVESIQYLAAQQPNHLVSSILTRTLVDHRYFHGIRTMAAAALAKHAKEELDWIGFFHLQEAFQEFFCIPHSPMTRSNDFSDRSAYIIQCAIPRGIAKIRGNNGRAPIAVKGFFLEKLKFNDNTNNEFSDCYYVATLMRCLAESLVSSKDQSFYETFEEDLEELEFQKQAIDVIRRYQRIDEWIPSHQNIYTTTALDCLHLLMRSSVIPRRMAEFMHYTQVGNSDVVRLKALSCMVELGMLKNTAMMEYLISNLETDSSPYIRDQVYHLLGRGFGIVALEKPVSEMESKSQPDGLIIDRDAETRAADIRRTHTVEGALDSFRKQLRDHPTLKRALRATLDSPVINLKEFGVILELCHLLKYDQVNNLMVKLHYPRYWGCRHLGKAKMVFFRTSKFRTKRMEKIELPPPLTTTKPSSPATSRKQSLVLSTQHRSHHASHQPRQHPAPKPERSSAPTPTSLIPPPTAPAPTKPPAARPSQLPAAPTGRQVLKIKFNNPESRARLNQYPPSLNPLQPPTVAPVPPRAPQPRPPSQSRVTSQSRVASQSRVTSQSRVSSQSRVPSQSRVSSQSRPPSQSRTPSQSRAPAQSVAPSQPRASSQLRNPSQPHGTSSQQRPTSASQFNQPVQAPSVGPASSPTTESKPKLKLKFHLGGGPRPSAPP